ncbi:hypothetical protein [Ensifer adhaerens]|uniref:PNPLA domain-containing protein n=1 Tax=Ensifer adhaerens TaxID=106592 RepID=A0A9Q9DDM6_ENSAD|nr:hypothetical protein [Ensifer adhaerens]USJ27580.1 hypothetical protein NE863_34735 [Ensifer adhaerens]
MGDIKTAGVDLHTELLFDDVFRSELEAINGRRRDNARPEIASGRVTAENGLTGLALSGGGLRSAAFCLGAIQGLNSKQLVSSVDYLSTVSGGGYTGSTLTIWLSQTPRQCPFGRTDQAKEETPVLKHIRDNSRYLFQNGLPSIITALAVYLRGLASNAIVVLPILFILSAFLLSLNADTNELAQTRGVWIDWSGLLGTGAMRFSILAVGLCAIGLAIYAILVSVIPLSEMARRKRGTHIAAWILLCAGAVVLVDLHTEVVGTKFRVLAPRYAGGADLVDRFKAAILWLSPLAAFLVPYVNVIANKASGGDAGGWREFIQRILSRLVLLALASLIPVLLWFATIQITYWGTVECLPSGANRCATALIAHAPYVIQWLLGANEDGVIVQYWRWRASLWYASFGGALLLLWPFINVNANSLHQLYRDRLGSAFLVKPDPEVSTRVLPADGYKLSDVQTNNAPYPLLNAALNVPGSRFANRRGRNADFFFFSPRYIGSEATGYVETRKVEAAMRGFSLGTATAISGAAAAPNMGMQSVRPLSLTIALLNVRLGYWLRHPRHIKLGRRILKNYPGPVFLLSEALSKTGLRMTKQDVTSKETGFVFLTDGGHIDNLGIYGLLRRRCRLIFAIDAEADAEMTFPSLMQLQRLARIDLNVTIDLKWEKIARFASDRKDGVSRPHAAVGVINYPPLETGGEWEKGVLIYIKSSVSGDENDYVLSYAASHKQFPHETTADQLFSEEQFEVYRALGEHVVSRLVSGSDQVALPDDADAIAILESMLPGVDL